VWKRRRQSAYQAAAVDAAGLVTIGVRPGERVVVRLGFDPTDVEVTLHGHALSTATDRRLAVSVDHSGILQVFASTSTGDVSYYARLRAF